MPRPPHPLPDCPLETVRSGQLPDADRRAFLWEAGEACARYVREGGHLADLQWEHSRIRSNRIELHPAPIGPRAVYPARTSLEQGLHTLLGGWRTLSASTRDKLTFLIAFTRSLAQENPDSTTWLRLWLRQLRAEHRQQVLARYQVHFHQSRPDRELSLNGLWVPDPTLDPAELLEALENMHASRPLHHSRRASVQEGHLLGKQVVVKRFAPNPSSWRRRWEVSRARRAWSSSCLLQELGVRCASPLGWLECREQGRLGASYFISRQLPTRQHARSWLRRNLPHWDESERNHMRHLLRAEIQLLHAHGVSHADLKLSNLMVRERPHAPPVFYWIDLEDLRVDGPSFRTFIRNLYQLNGSLPREVRREERLAFVRGFQPQFPSAGKPWLHWYVERETRIRLKRELRRVCGA